MALALVPGPFAFAQTPDAAGDFGDAPDGILAYSNVDGFPVMGAFPSRRNGLNGTIFHGAAAPGNNMFLGWSVDDEWDSQGNACATSPYEQDEPTENDCDAGVVGPTPFTIVNGVEQPMFGVVNPRPLGVTGQLARWGQGPNDNIDVFIQNNTDSTAYLNVLADWDGFGSFDSTTTAPSAPGTLRTESASSGRTRTLPVAVLKNVLIPANFVGYASQLNVYPFLVSSRAGFVWVRFIISPTKLFYRSRGMGAGIFLDGETEDYLFWVPPGYIQLPDGELGDAPDGVQAYDTPYDIGHFPTCIGGGNGCIWHDHNTGMYFGPSFSYETDGNRADCSFNPYDNDESYMDGDAGLIRPEPWTILGGGYYALGPHAQSHDIGPAGGVVSWGPAIDISVTNQSTVWAYVNVLFDWDRSGDWGGEFQLNGHTVSEHPVQNVQVGAGSVTPLSALMQGLPLALGGEGYVWVRFTISESPVSSDWNGSGSFLDGETEDYLLHVGPPATAAVGELKPSETALTLSQSWPNPMTSETRIAFRTVTDGPAQLEIYDVAGRLVRSLVDTAMPAGDHEVAWDRRDDRGLPVSNGIYLYRLTAGGESVSRRLVIAGR